MSDQDIVRFCEFTNATPEEAKTFLEIADSQFETAVTLYLENGGAPETGSTIPTSSSSDMDNNRLLSDEEFARQMQESENQVRAPIAPKTDILAGGSPGFHPSLISSRNNIGISRPSVFNQGDSTTGSVTDFLSRLHSDVVTPSQSSTGSPSSSVDTPITAKAKRLADLFRPPFDIMFKGGFEEARETAKEQNKWLIVNIHDPTEFQCQVLNRDLWSDAFVKDIIKESFIFLQYTNSSTDGSRYSTFYQVRRFPHVGIIDPLTGERMKLWEKPLTPTDFMMEVTEFLDHYSPESSKVTSSIKRAKTAKNVSDMSEEEQLNAAIEASLNASNANKSESSSPISVDMDIEPTETGSGSGKNQQVEEEQEEEKAGSAFDAIKPIKRDETTDVANSTRIQLRMGDGSRMIRRFLKKDPVRYLFEFVKAEVPGANDQPFELVFNRIQLIDSLDKTIEDAGLNNAAVNCVFV